MWWPKSSLKPSLTYWLLQITKPIYPDPKYLYGLGRKELGIYSLRVHSTCLNIYFLVKNDVLLRHFVISYLIVSTTLTRMQCEGKKKLYLFFLDKHISHLMSFLFMQHFDEFSVTYMNKMFFTNQHNGFLIVKIDPMDSLAHK